MALSEREKLELEREKLQLEIDLEEEQQSLSQIGPQVSKTESVLRGAGQGVTAGFQDDLSALIEPGVNLLMDKLTGRKGAEAVSNLPEESFTKRREGYREENAEAQAANPTSYLLGQLGGMAPSMAITGGSTLGGQMAAGAGMGAVTGAGFSEQEDLEGIAQDAGIGAAFGGLSPALIAGINKYGIDNLKKLAPKLAQWAEKSAENATGATAAQLEKFKPGAGRKLLDSGIVKAFRSQRGIEQAASKQMSEAGQVIDDVMTSLGKSGKAIDPQKIQLAIDDKIAAYATDPSKAQVVRQLESMKDDIMNSWIASGGDDVSPLLAEQTKRGYQSLARKSYGDPDRQLATKDVARLYREAVEGVAEEVDPAMLGQFKKAKDTYGLLEPVQEAAERRANVTQQSPFGGFGDLVLGGLGATGTGLASGDLETGLGTGAALIAARRFVHPRIASTGAVGLDKLSKGLNAIPNISQNASRAMQSGARGAIPYALQDKPENLDIPIGKMGKYDRLLEQEKARGKLNTAHYVLFKRDPEYQRLYNEAQKQKGEVE